MLVDMYLAMAAMIGLANAHGFLTSPKPRMPGKSMAATCGQQVYSNQQSDNYGNIQGMLQVANSQSDYNAADCNIWLCKGYKADDNTNVQSFSVGQVVPITFDVRAPHTGTANISVVDTASNSVIGEPLASYSVFASNSATIPANETSLSVTIPDLNGKCTTAGECVIQHFWDARSIDQTYESCIDFTVGGSGSSSGTSSSTGAASRTTAAATAPASSSVVSVPQTSAAAVSVPAASSVQASPTTFATSFVAKPATSSVAPATSSAPTGEDDDDEDSCDA